MCIRDRGGRMDHTLANISLTAFAAKNGAICHLIDEHHQIFAIKDDSIMVKKGYWKWLSVFAMDSEVKGVTLRGLKYPLHDAVLTNTYPIGVSLSLIPIYSDPSGSRRGAICGETHSVRLWRLF